MRWFKHKAVNRRMGRRPVLEVKLRSDVVRRARLRWSGVAAGILFGTVLGVFLLWRAGEWAVSHFITANDAFAIQQIQVQTDGDIAPDQIQRWAGVKPGQNLFALDLARVKRDLELVPYLKTATVERVLPHTLRVRVMEREPLAQISAPQLRPNGVFVMATLFLDEEACVMPALDAVQRTAPAPATPPMFPVITGFDFGKISPGRQLDAPQVRAALQLIIAFDRSAMVGLDELRQIDVSAPDALQVHTALGGDVTFSARNLDRQLRRWRQIYDAGKRMQWSIASLDLAVSNNIPARWLMASPGPQPVPKAGKAPRNRKKNV